MVFTAVVIECNIIYAHNHKLELMHERKKKVDTLYIITYLRLTSISLTSPLKYCPTRNSPVSYHCSVDNSCTILNVITVL